MSKGRICLTVTLTAALVVVASAYGQSTDAFRWINPQHDATLWGNIQDAFRGQLKPSHSDYGELYGYLKRVGIFENSALVIAAYKVGSDPKDGFEYASAFNYDTTTKSTSKIAGLEGMWFWKFTTVAQLEPSPAPDVLFTYDDCQGCEPDEILTSLRYDSAARQWQIRRWKGPKDWTTDTGLIVESAPEPDDPLISDDNLYGLIDLAGAGFDDVGLRSRWVRETASHHRQVNDLTLLYGAKNGVFVGRIVSDKAEQLKVWSKLCVNNTNKLCRDTSAPR